MEGLQDLRWLIFNLRWDYPPNFLPPQSTPGYHYPQAWQLPIGEGLWLMTIFLPAHSDMGGSLFVTRSFFSSLHTPTLLASSQTFPKQGNNH